MTRDIRVILLKHAHMDFADRDKGYLAAGGLDEAAAEQLLTAAEVAVLFRVSSKTVGRWGRSGALPLYRTIGGHHRYRLSDVRALSGLRAVDPIPRARRAMSLTLGEQ